MTAVIVAVDENWAIGRDGGLLCHLPSDLKRFKQLTMGWPIIMGRKTFESLPKGPLPGRLNVVVTHQAGYATTAGLAAGDNVVVCNSVEEAMEATASAEQRFIIGGAQLYAAAINYVDTLFLTRIHATFDDADTFFPAIDADGWVTVDSEVHPADDRNPYPHTFITLRRLRR